MLLKKSLANPLTLALATVATATLAQSASAATFNFSFSNVEGPVTNGTVQGTITLPDGDGTFAASAVTITSAPAVLGYTTPLSLDFINGFLADNSFTVSGGQINAASSTFFYIFPPGNNAFGLNATSFGAGGVSFLDAASGGAFGNTGVRDASNSTLTYTAAPTAATPEPATVLGLLSIAGVGLLGKRQKQEK